MAYKIVTNDSFEQKMDELINKIGSSGGTSSGGGSTPANAVTTDTAQTITGEKTFAQSIKITNGNYYRDGHAELCPDGVLSTDELGNQTFLEFPLEEGTLATQKYVDEAVENAGGGGSADVGEIQICCVANRLLTSSTTWIQDVYIEKGTPVVGKYVLCENGIALITALDGKFIIVEPIIKLGWFINGELQYGDYRFYAPTSSGNTGEFLTSDGVKPVWKSLDLSNGLAANVCMVTYDAPEEAAMLMYTLYGNYTGGYVYTLRDAYNLLINAVGETTVPASGVWIDGTTGNQAAVLAVMAMDGMFVAITSDMQQHVIDIAGDGEDYFAKLDFMPMPMGKTFDDSDNLTEGGEGEW